MTVKSTNLTKKIKKIILRTLLVLIFIVAGWYSLFLLDFTPLEGNVFGVSFSKAQAEYLGLNPKETYLALLDDLGVRNIRISVFWNQLEPKPDVYDFSFLDWQMDEMAKRNGKVILAVGRRVPRWPECHSPEWVKQLSLQEEEKALLEYLEKLVVRYQNHPALRIWQIENEVFLDLFGECPEHSKKLLLQEIALVRRLDPKHQIMITDSGEFGSWLRTAHLGDYLGTSIYRIVAQYWSGYVKYGGFIPPAHYRIKAWLVRKPIEKVIVSELQAEPWTPYEIIYTPISEQERSMNIEQFRKNIAFARRTGFREIYLWGAEWWYWMEKQGEPAFWEESRKLFQSSK